MSDKKYEQRKKMIYDFMCDSMYVPMKIKELANCSRRQKGAASTVGTDSG